MKYCKIQDLTVVQVSVNNRDGFIECQNNIVCGMIYDEESGEFGLPVEDFTKEKSMIEIISLYDSAMSSLQSKYTQTEINTFPRKSSSARSYLLDSDLCNDSDKYFLAKLEGVVNGSSPLGADGISDELSNISTKGWKAVKERAEKIANAERAYDFYLAKIEQMRNTAIGLLSDSDNKKIVDDLSYNYSVIIRDLSIPDKLIK